jgi:hypothetical protein
MGSALCWMTGSFLIGVMLGLYEKQLRRRFLHIAVSNPLRDQDATDFSKMTSEWSFATYGLMVLYLLCHPEGAMRRMRSQLVKYRKQKHPCSSLRS